MFARVNMGAIAIATLESRRLHGEAFAWVRRTVPGFKDLALAAKLLVERDNCKIVVAMGMPGPAELDRMCAHEASLGKMATQLMTSTPILEVFVHEAEGNGDSAKLIAICQDRCAKHALNAYDMLFQPESLVLRAGCGVR